MKSIIETTIGELFEKAIKNNSEESKKFNIAGNEIEIKVTEQSEDDYTSSYSYESEEVIFNGYTLFDKGSQFCATYCDGTGDDDCNNHWNDGRFDNLDDVINYIKKEVKKAGKKNMIDKWDLTNYIINYHQQQYKDAISMIKLHKSLYFLYAFWGCKIRQRQYLMKNGEIEEITNKLDSYNEELFNAEFEAWAWGPVEAQIYSFMKDNTLNCDESIKKQKFVCDDFILSFINYYLDKIFISNDFCLVDLAQEDKCWSNVYIKNERNRMNNKEIIEEYAKKTLNKY